MTQTNRFGMRKLFSAFFVASLLAVSCLAHAGFALQPNAPQITVLTPTGNRTFAIAVNENPATPVGDIVGVYLVENAGGEWLNVGPGAGFYQTLGGPHGLLLDMQAAGGSVKFTQAIAVRINAFLATVAVCAVTGCAAVPSSSGGEPDIDSTAVNSLSNAINGLRLQVVNGALILQ